jgi:hypothetical protein
MFSSIPAVTTAAGPRSQVATARGNQVLMITRAPSEWTIAGSDQDPMSIETPVTPSELCLYGPIQALEFGSAKPRKQNSDGDLQGGTGYPSRYASLPRLPFCNLLQKKLFPEIFSVRIQVQGALLD